MRRRLLLFTLLPVFSFLLLCQPPAHAQTLTEPEAVPFHISSLKSAFAMQGDFEGEYRIYPEAIKVRLTKALVRIGTHCPYKGGRQLNAVSLALATNNAEGRWTIAFESQKRYFGRNMFPGDEYTFDGVEFIIPKEATTDLAKHWFVVQMDDFIYENPTKKESVEGYAYAHSCRDIFVKKAEH